MALRLTVAAAVVAMLAAAWGLLQVLGLPSSLSPEVLSEWLKSQGAAGPLLLMLLMIMAVVVGPIPTLPITATAGLVFGVIPGSGIAATGAAIGAAIAFWIARFLGRDMVRRRFPENPVLAEDGSQRFLTIFIFVTRLVPIFSFALISYGAGVTAISTWRFILATFLGMLPMTVVYASLGSAFAVHPMFAVVAGTLILGVMIWVPWYLRRNANSRLVHWLGLDQPEIKTDPHLMRR